MKRIYFMLLSVVLFAMAGCTKDPSSDNKVIVDEDGNYVYMNIAMQLPVGTRSGTDWNDENEYPGGPGDSNSDSDKEHDDIEQGWDYENTVKTTLLVIADLNDKYLTHAEVTGILKGNGNDTYSIKAKFKREDIDKMYAEGFEKKVKMYAYVNYTYNLHDLFSKIDENGGRENNAWLHWSGTIDERPSKAGQTPIIDNTIWAKHSFLMTNATNFVATFPETADDWDNYATEKNPWNVNDGKIQVERAAARIDFKDASKGNNTYSIIGGAAGTTEEGLNLVNVQLTRMSLVNMSKNFYYLRRVSDGYGKDVKVCKNETMFNWVVDTDWDAKNANEINPANAANYFNFPLYGEAHDDHYAYNRPGWYTDNIKDILEKNNTDKWSADKSYHIWRYVTENTLPTIDAQKTVQSTGIVFKGLILPGADITAAINPENEETRYIWDAVHQALIASENHLPQFGDGSEHTSTNEVWDGKTELTEDSKTTLSYDYPAIYEFDGLLYAGFKEIARRAVLEGNGSLLYAAAQHILNHWVLVPADEEGKYKFVHENKANIEDTANATKLTVRAYNEIVNGVEHVDDGTTDYSTGNYTVEMDEKSPEFKSYATTFNDPEASNFTIYEASYEDVNTENGEGWGYYCYYFYWNRHNDNNLNGKMGQMEFAIVRNNVYKLSVSTVNRLGHPRNPDNDPDPYDPEDPDEEDRVYLTVDIQVLPWVVRVNEIEF